MISGISTRGLAAGAVAMFWITVSRTLFANSYFGLYPLVLGMLPFLVAIASGKPLLAGALPASLRRFAAPALAVLLPAVFWLKYSLSGGIPLLDGTSSPLQFFYYLILAAVYAGIPLDAIAASREEEPMDPNSTGWLLAGFAAGIALTSVLAAALTLPLLFAAQALLTTGTILPSWKAIASAADADRKPRSSRLPSPADVLFLTIPGVIAFTLPFILQTVAETPLVAEGSAALLAAAVVAGAGLGLLLALRWNPGAAKSTAAARPAMLNPSVLAGLASALILSYIFSDYWSGAFADFYRNWYEGGSAGFGMGGILSGTAIGVLLLTLASVVRGGRSPKTWDRFSLMASIGAGLLLAFFLRAMIPVHIAVYALIAPAMLIAVYEFARFFEKTIPASITLAAILVVGYLAFPPHQPTFRNYFDPVNFQITAEEHTPAGRMTLLRSRDYDDRFFALFWNQTTALTQSSRTVQNDLYRMGHIPMLMRPSGSRVLMLGLGSSLPLEAVMMHEPVSVDCVEPMAAALRLADSTRHTTHPWSYLHDVRFHCERIPAFLARSEGPFDVIISAEPLAEPQPDADLLTESYFHEAARVLSDGGVFMQWLPVARMDLASMRRVFTAVLDAFPHVELWLSSADPESAMIGVLASKTPFSPAQPSPMRFTRLMADPVRLFHLQQIQLDHFALVAACYATNQAGVRALAADAAPYTMFDPPHPLQDRAPQSLMADVDRVLNARTAPDRMMQGKPDSVRTLTTQILAARPTLLRARMSVMAGDDSSAIRLLSAELNAAPRNGEVRRVFGDLMLRQAAGYVGAASYPTAVALLNGALQLLPLNTYMLRLFMIASFNIGDREASGLAIDGIKRIDPSHAGFRDNQATIRAKQGATDDALLLYENAITLDPRNEEFYCNMASFHYSQKRIWEAIRVLDMATDRAYYPAKAWYLKGMFYGEQGRLTFAREAFERYLDVATPLDPNRADVEKRLEQLRDVKEK